MFPDNEGFVPTMRVLTLCSGEDCRLRSLNVASSMGGGLQVFKGQEKFFPILLYGPAGFFAPYRLLVERTVTQHTFVQLWLPDLLPIMKLINMSVEGGNVAYKSKHCQTTSQLSNL